MASDHDHVSRLWEMLQLMSGRHASVASAVTQPWRSRRYDWYDAAAFDEVIVHAQHGWVAISFIAVGAHPGRDRDLTGNREKLARLPEPFHAAVTSGGFDCDGWLEWRQAIDIEHPLLDETQLRLRFPPSGVPLEIGHTEPETTIWHLRSEGGVARWPYESSHLALILATTGPPPGRGWPLRTPTLEDGRIDACPVAAAPQQRPLAWTDSSV